MNVLGINQIPGMLAWFHDSAAALIRNGTIVAAAEEERFNRIRHARGYPSMAIEYCLREGGIEKSNVDIIAISQDPYQFLKNFPTGLSFTGFLKQILNIGIFAYYKKNAKKEFPNAKIVYIPHHRAHAASAYRCSGFLEANILTIDASGETETFTFFTGRGGIIKKVWDIRLDGIFGKRKRNSIGLVYTRATHFLNLGAHAEGKTMGLASYGTARYDMSSILSIRTHDDFSIDRDAITTLYRSLERKNAEPLTEEHKDFAASIQGALETSILNLAREAYEASGIRKFCLAGGVALNCNTNSRLLASDFCDDLFVQPASNDGGVALGAALEAASIVGVPINEKMEHAYWGPGFSNEEIEAFLKEAKVPYEFHEDIESAAADILASGKIIGWFEGRMELGPRALCNRSIMADPSVVGMNDRVNRSIKHREPWRPFAPVVTEDDVHQYFDESMRSPFMLLTFYVKESRRELLPAITHVDGSSRIQTINRDQNPRCYRLLKEFEKRKGFPVLMNTSFNDKNEPIVATPKDALRCFYSTGLDALVMGNFLVIKENHG